MLQSSMITGRQTKQVDWVTEIAGTDCSTMWETFRDKLHDVPKKKLQTKQQQKNRWMTKSTLKLMKKWNKAWHTYTIFASSSNYNRYKTLHNQVTKSIRRDKVNHQHKLIQNFKQGSEMFYGYMHTMQTVRSRVPNIHDTNGNLTKTDQETASVLCDYFGNTFVHEPQLNETIVEDDEENFQVPTNGSSSTEGPPPT